MSISDIKIIETNTGKDITKKLISKIIDISFNESLEGEGDSISIELKNNTNSPDYWPDDYFIDREFNLTVSFGLLNCGEFNIDRVDIYDSIDDKRIVLQGISAPIMTDPSIYTQVRKVWPLKKIPEILSELANIIDMRVDFFFEDAKNVRTKVQIQNEYLFNSFTRLAEKYGAFTKVYRDATQTSNKWTFLFIGRQDLAYYASNLRESPLDVLPGRTKELIIIDKTKKSTLKHTAAQFSLISDRQELEIVYYDPLKKRKYTKKGANKTKLFLSKSRKDYEIVKVASKEEADLVAKKIESEPAVIGMLSGQFNPNWLSGNIVEMKNYSTLRDGFYIIMSSSHRISPNGRLSSCSLEKLPDLN